MGNAAELPGMPEPYQLTSVSSDGETVIYRGPYVVGRYEDDDVALRNLVIVSLREAGHSGRDVAACFSLSEETVARLRARTRREGSAGLLHHAGRPRTLTLAKAARARSWSDDGLSNAQIARRLGVHPGTIGRLLGKKADIAVAMQPLDLGEGVHDGDEGPGDAEEEEDGVIEDEHEDGGEPGPEPAPDPPARAPGPVPLFGRIEEEARSSRYAGAMLLHPFLCRLGVDDVVSSLGRAARRYDAPSLVLAAVFGFSLGIDSLEGAKHLLVNDAGALIGTGSYPHLRTLRPALKSLAASCDPLALQRAFATTMLASDQVPPELFYVDDHFVTYWGARPVAKGYNIRRHLAEPGRDDTFCVDERWRAICFSSGEPKGLSVTIGGVIGQLKEIIGDRPAMVGFDRGGSYPKVFSDLVAAGMDWITWRRAPLAAPKAAPRRSWVMRDSKRRGLLIADEEITLEGYDAGPVRQLSSIEDGTVVFQILTSNTALRPGPLVAKLRGRWCIENFNKYAEDHHGIHWLASYDMEVETDTTLVANPARTAARRRRNDAKAAVAEGERQLGVAMEAHHPSVDDRIAAINARRDALTMTRDALDEATAALRPIPAKRPRNELDPSAKRARPHLGARALQMVCRLLAYNAELDLARRFNAYLDDLDEHRAISRQLLHLGGTIAYRRRAIDVTLERPDSPRVARALGQLIAELNDGPTAHLNGDRRPITYQVAAP